MLGVAWTVRGQHEGDYDTKQHLMANRESSLKESSGGGVPRGRGDSPGWKGAGGPPYGNFPGEAALKLTFKVRRSHLVGQKRLFWQRKRGEEGRDWRKLYRRCRKITLCPAGCIKDCTPSLRIAKSWKDFNGHDLVCVLTKPLRLPP